MIHPNLNGTFTCMLLLYIIAWHDATFFCLCTTTQLHRPANFSVTISSHKRNSNNNNSTSQRESFFGGNTITTNNNTVELYEVKLSSFPTKHTHTHTHMYDDCGLQYYKNTKYRKT